MNFINHSPPPTPSPQIWQLINKLLHDLGAEMLPTSSVGSSFTYQKKNY